MIDICNKEENNHTFQRICNTGREMISQGVAGYAPLSLFNKAKNYAMLYTTDDNAKALLRGVRFNQLRLIEEGKSLAEQLDHVLLDAESFSYAMREALKSMHESHVNYLNTNLFFDIIPFEQTSIEPESLDDFMSV